MKFLNGLLFALLVVTTTLSVVFYNNSKRKIKEVKTIPICHEVLQQKLVGEPPAWMLKQIQHDLNPYVKSGITKQMLDEAFSGSRIEEFSLIRFIIQDGHITFSHDEKNLYARHFKEFLAFLKKLNQEAPLPNVDFLVSLEDGFGGNPGIGPCFVFAKNAEEKSLILIPDIKALVGYEKLRWMIPEASESHPWEKKLTKSFWRGSTTGGYSTLNTWDRLARAKLVLLSLDHPGAIDARFHSVVQCDPEVPLLMRAKGMVSSSVTKPDHLKYKYLVDVDGNSCSYERYFWLLLSNSLVLKQVTPNIQWYYGGLEPYKHYVPVKEDLSDLLAQIQWAKDHDLEARLISEEATQFVKENLGAEDIALYFYLLLKEYAHLQK